MSYRRGDLHFAPVCPVDEEGYCERQGEFDVETGEIHGHPMDAHENNRRIYGEAYLDHSCGEWVIGTKARAKELIEDLERWINE